MDNYLGWGPGGAGAARLNDLDAKVTALETYSKQPSTLSTTLNATTQIVSVTDSVDGMADVEVGSATLNQVVVNGDFANGTTGWSNAGLASFTVSNKVATILANSQFDSIQKYLGSFKIGDKIFISASIKTTSPLIKAYLRQIDSPYSAPITLTHSGSGLYEKLYGVATISNTTQHYYLEIRDERVSGFDNILIDGNVGVFAIPITGTPYESMTADQINNIVGEYWEGLKSVERVDVVSSGRNLFDISTSTNGFYIDYATGTQVPLNNFSASDFIRVKPNQAYTWTNFNSNYAQFDKNKQYITTPFGSSGTYTFTTAPNCAYVRLSISNVNLAGAMFNEGSTALPYQPYDGSKLTVRYNDRTKFDGALLPNLKDNEVNVARGYISAVKRVQRYVLQASDITGLITTPTGYDYLSLIDLKLLGYKGGLGSSVISNNMIITGFPKEVVGNQAPTVFPSFSSDNVAAYLHVVDGTYPNLAAAQAALAGTVIYYELATPIFIPYEQFDDYGIDVDGILSSSDDYSQFYLDNYNLLPPTPIVYPINLAASLKSLKDAIKSIRDWESNQELINLQFDARLVAGGH